VNPRDEPPLLASFRAAVGDARGALDAAPGAFVPSVAIPAVAAPGPAVAPKARLPALPSLVSAGKCEERLRELLEFARVVDGRKARYGNAVHRRCRGWR